MDKRLKRYLQKLEVLRDRLDFINSNLPSEKEMINNRILRKAIYKEFQELIEVIADLCAMSVKDRGFLVKDDYSNIERMDFILTLDLIESLKRSNGLRNVLVHDYNGINDNLAYISIKELLPAIYEFEKRFKEWISK
ncbi:MAG: DUF86 domain-containing protein [Methanosarcinales archaeon]